MDFCHIAPTAYLRPLNMQNYTSHLVLAHLVENGDNDYANFYGQAGLTATIILDNSAYELYRRNLPMFDGNKLLNIADMVGADYIVMPDYPGENAGKTAAAALEYAPLFKEEGYGTFFVPQSRIGHLEEYISSFAWAASHPDIDYIGMSILGIPNAFGVDGNDFQRLLSRWRMFNILDSRGLLDLAKENGKKIHCLGMTDGPNETALLGPFIADGVIDTWDTSAAVWAGIEGVAFDNSPTGLVNGKVKSHVDFDRELDDSKLSTIVRNMDVIDKSVDFFSNYNGVQ
jgi:hypothetical protein